MTSELHQQCAVCAWRADCQKKHTIKGTLRCTDFVRDANLGADAAAERPREKHKQVEDVFGTSKRK